MSEDHSSYNTNNSFLRRVEFDPVDRSTMKPYILQSFKHATEASSPLQTPKQCIRQKISTLTPTPSPPHPAPPFQPSHTRQRHPFPFPFPSQLRNPPPHLSPQPQPAPASPSSQHCPQ